MNARPGASPNGSSPCGRRTDAPIPPAMHALGESDRDAALGDVVGAVERPGPHARPDRLVRDPDSLLASAGGSSPDRAPARAACASSDPTDEGSNGPTSAIASPSRANPSRPARAALGQLADHADHRRREDRPARRLVVERDVAADDRDTERLARLGQSLDRLGQLPGDVRLLGVAEVQAVRQPERLGADAGEVGGALVDRLGRAAARIAGDSPAVAVDRRPRSPDARPASTSTAASASSGRRTVRDWTIGSYCSNTGRREAMFAEREQREQRLRRRLVAGQHAASGARVQIGSMAATGSRS